MPDGGKVNGVIARPDKLPAATVLLVHEWWGLNDQIKSVAAEFAKQGYIAVAVDLYNGKVATTPAEARSLMGAVDEKHATAQIKAMADHLRSHRTQLARSAP